MPSRMLMIITYILCTQVLATCAHLRGQEGQEDKEFEEPDGIHRLLPPLPFCLFLDPDPAPLQLLLSFLFRILCLPTYGLLWFIENFSLL